MQKLTYILRIVCTFFLFQLLVTHTETIFAQSIVLTTEGTYQSSEQETTEVGEDKALLNAKENILEQASNSINLSTNLKNSIANNDSVKTISDATMRVIILEKKQTKVNHHLNFYVKIKALIDLDKLGHFLKTGIILEDKPTKTTNAISNTIYTMDPDIGNVTMNQLLWNGINNQDIDTIKVAINGGANVNIWSSSYHIATPLTTVAEQNNLDILNYLVSIGADINVKDRFGNTPIMKIMSGNRPLYIIQSMVGYGADVRAINDNGQNLLMILTDSIGGSIENRRKIIQYLIDQGVDINHPDRNGVTPLISEVQHNADLMTIIMLIKAGANIMQTDSNGKTAFDYAVIRDKKDLINLFLQLKS